MIYALLADEVAIVHAGVVAFIVCGFVLINFGAVAGWKWVRGFCFRVAHLAAITLVCAESITEWVCPLTSMESRLRELGGGAGYSRDFVGYWIDRLIFYDFPPAFFRVAYVVFGATVVITFVVVPPRWPGRR